MRWHVVTLAHVQISSAATVMDFTKDGRDSSRSTPAALNVNSRAAIVHSRSFDSAYMMPTMARSNATIGQAHNGVSFDLLSRVSSGIEPHNPIPTLIDKRFDGGGVAGAFTVSVAGAN